MTRAVLVVLVLGGCWKSTGEAPIVQPPETPDPNTNTTTTSWRPVHRKSPCETAIDRAVELMRDDPNSMGPQLVAMIDDVRAAALESCSATAWSDEVLGCFTDAQTSNDIGTCASKMTPDQSRDMSDRMIQLMKKARSVPAVPPPPPPTP